MLCCSAVSENTDMLELDCHITKDGHVVVSHDNDLQRTTGHQLLISETLYKDLPLLKTSLRPEFAFDQEVCAAAEVERRIPQLKEVFEKFPKVPINVDIKFDSDKLISEVSSLVRHFGREDITVWGNKDYIVTEKCHKQDPSIPLLFSKRRVLELLLLFYTGLLPFFPIEETFYEVFMPTIFLRTQSLHHQYSVIGQLFIRFMDLLVMNRYMFHHLTARGIPVYLWVLNDEKDFKRAFDYGATGVMTDYPTKLRRFLDANPQYN
ncbi:Lysophospholipase D GDPD1 [Lamellibrachia satsuma]|nr:Lysophospholipase D GDPD1 [Lamellibrachia satsuma]